VIDRTGAVVARFDPSITPGAPEVRAVIQKALDS
jgi:glutathione peroxidase-family protein